MRREGVDLRDPGHVGHERGADTATAADQVAVLQRVLHELLRRHINHVIVVVEDGIQFDVHAVLYDLRRGRAVDTVHFLIDEILELLG